ncbi:MULTISPECIES: vancomycin high temperature exclusion protein [Aequorivita]|uniref:YdcF family protein n=1 Tax=Aequorivita iocasae TaxID=2803865 RepID=A0ABX7DN58_9FLAO|nr:MULTISPECIES: ElyC/SanA/YdcF family protein [Aequorivita]QQX75510.1 YdcF family protein [Aequorivita iocasae]UCA54964.1 YdcF family protein [Aequorivita sp. F7]
MKTLFNKIAKLYKWALLLSPFVLFAIICLDTYVLLETENQTFQSTEEIPHNRVGLLLGTSKFIANGDINLYCLFRIRAAVELFKAGKIDFILVSGDNGRIGYNEPLLFKKDLIQLGIPEEKIVLDYAGFSTLDSVLRAQKIFGLNRFTVISQSFHNERAIFLAKQKGIAAIGFNAETVAGKYSAKTELREYLARIKACLDIVFDSRPKYLGEKIAIQ